MPKGLNIVKCSKCGEQVGLDKIVTIIESCLSCSSKKKNKKPKSKNSSAPNTEAEAFLRIKKGPAKDLPEPFDKIMFRSGWERNFARILCKRGIVWDYEKLVFTFSVNKEGKPYKTKPYQYMPDFHEIKTGVIWEIKGYFRSEDKSKIKRFKALYPEDFKRLKVCLSKANKKAIAFYQSMDIEVTLIEDLKEEWQNKLDIWE